MVSHIPEEISIKNISDKVEGAILDLLLTCGPDHNVDNVSLYSRNKTLLEMGLDPLQLLQLRNRLTKDLQFEVYPAFFQEYPTPSAIIKFFVETKIQSLRDLVYEIEWHSTSVPEVQEMAVDNLWILFCEEDAEVAAILKAMLHEHRQQCILVQPGKKFHQTGTDHFVVNPQASIDFKLLFSKIPNISKLAGVIYLWGYQTKVNVVQGLQEYHKKTCEGLVNVANQLALQELPLAARLWVVTESVCSDGNDKSLADWPLNGLCKIIREEYPTLHCTYLAMDSKVSVVEACDSMFREITSSTQETQIAYQNSNRIVPRMVRGTINEIKMPHFSPDSTYLIAGGLRLMGIHLAKWYVAHGAKHLVLLDEIAVMPEVQVELDEFTKQGIEVVVFCAKLDNESALKKIINEIQNKMLPLKGIIHAAGLVDNDLLLNMTWERFEDIYRLKVSGSWNLHKLTESIVLDHFILFSSSLPDLAPLGKANHAVGNSFLDALAHYRRKRGMAAIAFDWGPRDLRHIEVKQLVEVSLTKSVESLKVQQVFQVLEQLFYFNKPQLTVAAIKWAELLHGLGAENPLFEELAIEMGFKRVDVLGAYLKATTADRIEILQNYIHEQLRRLLNLHSSHRIELRRDFTKLGLGPLGMISLKNRIQKDFHEAVTVPINFVEAHPNIEELATGLSRLLKTVVEPVSKLPLSKIAADLHEPIAIIGISCRFPGNVSTPENFWKMLRVGVDTITEDTETGRFGGFVEDLKTADPTFFFATSHHLSLELAWEALENAGMPSDAIRETRTGVFVGAQAGLSDFASDITKYFNLSGPSLVVDAGGVSSSAALEIAIEKLRLGICDLAFAGGIAILDEDRATQPADGKTRSLDARASGSVMGEGGGLFLLKRHSDAIRDNDQIMAVIKGIALEGPGSIQAALNNARIDPSSVQYIEVEGSGSVLEDSVEVNTLCALYGEGRSRKNPLYIGSVKTNIGNTQSAAGFAAVLKCVMALQNDELPPELHFNELNPLIEEGRNYIKVLTAPEPWLAKDQSRTAAVNSFSLDGRCAHIILQKAEKIKPSKEQQAPCHIVTLSAKSSDELEELIALYKQFLTKSPATLADIAYTSNTGRDHFDYRAVLVAKDHKELIAKIHKNEILRGKKVEEKYFKDKPTADLHEWLEKLAQEYVSGASIDWNSLYENGAFSKVVLPTYPFKKGKAKNMQKDSKSKTMAPISEITAEALSDNLIIIKGDRHSESDLVKIKELKENRHINTVIVVYKE